MMVETMLSFDGICPYTFNSTFAKSKMYHGNAVTRTPDILLTVCQLLACANAKIDEICIVAN